MTGLLLGLAFAADPVASFDFSVGPQGAVASGDTLQWAWSAAPAAGPGGASWGTNPDGQYLHDAEDVLAIALPALAPGATPTLILAHGYDIVAGDEAWVEVEDGGLWVPVEPMAGYPTATGFGGDSGGWRVDAFDLSALAAPTAVRFRLSTDTSQAADGWYVASLDLYDTDVVPPSITPLVVPSDTQDLDGPYALQLAVRDTAGVASVTLHWSTSTGDGGAVPMTAATGDVWRGEIPGQAPATEVSWWVEASDGVQTSAWPDEGEASFRVFLAAPTALAVVPPAPRVATSLAITWTAPVSPHRVEGYLVEELGGAVVEVSGPPATVPLTLDAEQRFVVTADYGALGLGDPSVPLRAAVEVPSLTALVPDRMAVGAGGWVQLEGEGLYLLDGASSVELGADVEVVSVEVIDVGAATLRVEVAAGAVPGPRDLVIEGAQGPAVFPDAFTVAGDDEAPRVLDVVPGSLVQGREATVAVTVDRDLLDDVRVELPEGLVLTQPAERLGPRAVALPLAAAVDARAGSYTVVLDDGAALYPFALRVDPYDAGPQKSCAHGAGGAGWLGLGGLLLLFRRRPVR